MLDPWIIEEIRRREDERHKEEGRGRLELPLESPHHNEAEKAPVPTEERDRGVVIIDI
jgi:hypothetical protein